MPGYWWKCDGCNRRCEFNDPDLPADLRFGSVAPFIRDVLVPKNWNPVHLLRHCPGCGQQALRIAYEFPRENAEQLRVIGIVDLTWDERRDAQADQEYLPMMWETYFLGNRNRSYFDFKYIRGKRVWGLNKPAVFSQNDLRRLFEKYCQTTPDIDHFP